MAQVSYPGVYVQEAPAGPGPIQGTSPSGLGLVGFTTRGPINYPTLCTSYADFVSKFGTFTADSLTPTVAYAAFANGLQQLWQVRVVHDDAAKAHIDWIVSKTAEVLTDTVSATGLYTLDTLKVPVVAVVPGTVRIEFLGARNNIFTDNGLGVLADAGGAGSGGSGSIDYETGQISIQLTAPTDYAGGADDVVINYQYKVATFTMDWPGAAGNYVRLRVIGSPNYYSRATASYTAFTVYVEENITPTETVATWEVRETFDPVTFSDPNDSNYFKSLMNDPLKGSDYVDVTDYGNAQNIADLAGTAVVDETITNAPAYNGTNKAFVYTLPTAYGADGLAEGTLAMRFKFIESGLRIGTGDGTNAPVTTALGYAIDAGGGTPTSAKVTVGLTLTAGGAITIYDDGAGNLRTSPFSPGTVHGTVDYTDGTVTLSISGTTVVAGTAITINAVYADDVNVVDDGNGNLAISTPAVGTDPPTKFQFNSNASNAVDYDAGTATITWQVSGAPAQGPAGVGAVPGATAAYKVGAVEPYALTPSAHFDLEVDLVATAAVTFTATPGSLTDSTAYPCADLAGLTTILAINGVNQTVTFVGATTTAANIINQINAQIVGAYAVLDTANVKVVSDMKGTGSSVAHVAGGTGDAIMLWATPAVAGGGNVADITAVTAAEVKTIVENATTANVTVNSDGSYTITSPTTGATSELNFTSAITVLGLVVEDIFGTTGTTVAGQSASYYTAPDTQVLYTLASGADGSATERTDVTSATLEATNAGMYALKLVDENMQVVIADFQTDDSVIRDVITFCGNMKDKFGIFTAPEGLSYQEAVKWKKFTVGTYTNRAAVYYPHIRITDPVTGNTMNMPVGGHVAGLYAKTDNNKNVAKTPAGTDDGALSFFEGLEVSLQNTEVGYCNQNNLNCLVDWATTGTVVWGGRTMEVPGGSFQYISQRRTFMYVEKSIYNATHVHVFQNNGPALWSAIALQVTNFLQGLTRAGYFASTVPSEAFFVICDSTNNSADSPLVYCDVGLATTTPAEFIVFTFSRKSIE